MSKLLFFLLCFANLVYGQTYHPAPGNVGTNAIHKDSSCFIGWATGGTVQRGYVMLTDTTQVANGSNRASFGNVSLACGHATSDISDIVSLGDSGSAIMTFDHYLFDGPGYDFAVFENGFTDNYMEFAHVEISSDGIHFFRFPSTTEIQTSIQLTNTSYSDCRMVNNLAGKYRVGYGTPFDISDIADDPLLDKNNIRYIKIIDAIGNVGSGTFTTDNQGTKINDPFPTPFESGGFDLEAIGVIHGQLALNLQENNLGNVQISPNPATEYIKLVVDEPISFQLVSLSGVVMLTGTCTEYATISVQSIPAGSYLINFQWKKGSTTKRLVVIH